MGVDQRSPGSRLPLGEGLIGDAKAIPCWLSAPANIQSG
jgi:hypothetical protein